MALEVVATVARLRSRGDGSGAAAARSGRASSLQTRAEEGTTTQREHLAEEGKGCVRGP